MMNPPPEPQGYLRVYFEDDSWATIPTKVSTTAKQVCDLIARKRNLAFTDHYYLYACEVTDEHLFERRLEDDEVPLEIRESVRKHGQLDSFRLVYKPSTQRRDDDAQGNSSGSDEEFFSQSQKMENCDRCGYIEKRGQRNTAWRERWFVLQGDKVYYFKSHTHNKAITFIPLADSVVREAPGRKKREFMFEINTKQRIYQLRAKSHADMMSWIRDLQKATTVNLENDAIDEAERMIENAEYASATADENLSAEVSTLQGLLANPSLLNHFMTFVEEQHSEENLLFWLDAQDYAMIERDEEERIARALEIFERYLQIGAEYELFLDGPLREEICNSIPSDISRSCFLQLQKKVFDQIAMGVFPLFLHSKQHQRALLNMPRMPSSANYLPLAIRTAVII
eukprot:TRINITY_DN299_c0_g1_i4.p1 TRINITY_DN299_c0_g1~~TRINITY_DN299_c0_g1_i4.p1  ORF type:complete len:397 (-),score=74.86 TRINITY_DN299_c0_g1_i4:1146-2336(-)